MSAISHWTRAARGPRRSRAYCNPVAEMSSTVRSRNPRLSRTAASGDAPAPTSITLSPAQTPAEPLPAQASPQVTGAGRDEEKADQALGALRRAPPAS
jgi:hypothetical protein